MASSSCPCMALLLQMSSIQHWSYYLNHFVFTHLFSSLLFYPCSSMVRTQYLYQNENYDKPFFCTYFKTSLFTLYLFVMGMIAPWREACERNTNNNYTVCVRYRTSMYNSGRFIQFTARWSKMFSLCLVIQRKYPISTELNFPKRDSNLPICYIFSKY